MSEFRVVPEPVYDRDERRLVQYYKRALKKIARQMGVITKGIEEAQATSLLKQIAFILRELDENTRSWVEETINRAFNDGQATA